MGNRYGKLSLEELILLENDKNNRLSNRHATCCNPILFMIACDNMNNGGKEVSKLSESYRFYHRTCIDIGNELKAIRKEIKKKSPAKN